MFACANAANDEKDRSNKICLVDNLQCYLVVRRCHYETDRGAVDVKTPIQIVMSERVRNTPDKISY